MLVSLVVPAVSFATAGSQEETTIPMEMYRPQFHFTSEKNWLNDPNGCVFYEGEYHLCFQHNPNANEWGNMTWGHAVSRDLVHWQQLANAIEPYGDGTIYSGTAVVDTSNSSGFQTGEWKPLAALFTHAAKPFGQALAYSNDKGRTWSLYRNGAHVVPNQGLDEGERDPKVFWHEPTRKWVMALWVKMGMVRFFTSTDLKKWEYASDFEAPGFFECPDMFELPVDGNPENRRWVIYDAAFNYWVGSFDGKVFRASGGSHRGDTGTNFYAAQTWNNVPGRVIQIAWMRGGSYPGMPFNQQMSFPCELELRTTSNGVSLCRWPVKEIESLYEETVTICDSVLSPGENPLRNISGELFDIEMAFEPGICREFGLRFHEYSVVWAAGEVKCAGTAAKLPAIDGIVRLRMLIDRTSLEVFGNGGEVSISSCILPKSLKTSLELFASGGNARIENVAVRRLRSAFDADADQR